MRIFYPHSLSVEMEKVSHGNLGMKAFHEDRGLRCSSGCFLCSRAENDGENAHLCEKSLY